MALYDSSEERLRVMQAVLTQQAASFTGTPGRASDRLPAPQVQSHTDLDQALEGADFVFCAIRVGGLSGRITDERVALDLGVLGQETTGPGGLAYGLRTLPEMWRIADRVRAVAPGAYFLNFTNPAGMITEALAQVLGDRVIGICDTPGVLAAHAVRALEVDPRRAQVDYVGLNHLGWLRRILVDGADRLPELLASDQPLRSLEEAQLFGPDWLRTLGSLPNEYLYYYYFNTDAVRSITEAPATRGEYLDRQQHAFYAAADAAPDRALELWRRTIAEREASYMAEAREGPRQGHQPGHQQGHQPGHDTGSDPNDGGDGDPAEADDRQTDGGYEQVALAVMAAIARDQRSTIILNVRNNGTIAGLPPDAVIEVPSLVDGSGARPLATVPPDLHQLGLMQQIKNVDRLIIEAARDGSPELALRAFALHPLVGSVSTARSLLAGYRPQIPTLR